jgi:DNA-directed RNA polymerase subunit F
MIYPIDLIIILGGNYQARAIKQVISLSKSIAKQCIMISSLNQFEDIKSNSNQWIKGNNLVIATEIFSSSEAMLISKKIYCDYSFWGALLIATNNLAKANLKSYSFVGIDGNFLYGSKMAEATGHGIINLESSDSLVTILRLLPDLVSITSKQFEVFLSQSPIGKLREIYVQNMHQRDLKIDSKLVQTVLKNLQETPREKWSYLGFEHRNIDSVRNLVQELYDICQVSQEIAVEKIAHILSQTSEGVTNV